MRLPRPGYAVVSGNGVACAIVWERREGAGRIVRVWVGRTRPEVARRARRGGAYPEARRDKTVRRVVEQTKRFLRGNCRAIDTSALDWEALYPFQRRVLRRERSISWGRVMTYGELARHIRTRGARAVGQALARNPFPVIIPCHRVIRHDRSIGGYSGGVRVKRMLLSREGWKIDGRGRVVRPARRAN